MAERHLIKTVVSVSAAVIPSMDATSEMDPSAVVGGKYTKQRAPMDLQLKL